MSEDRRESRRAEVSLPFGWLACSEREPLTTLCRRFGLPAYAGFQSRLNELESELTRALHDVHEPAVAAALGVLNAKLALVEQSLQVDLPRPEEHTVELSTGGITFTTDRALAPGDHLGIHLVLPSCFHIVCAGTVRHYADGRAGARLRDLDATAEKRLTRFLIGLK